ncbi:MAG: hypothetical protein KDB22_23945 [Planctomycetales bacterium]|nr:hypothetical protein [Planctomycetales bacterium]
MRNVFALPIALFMIGFAPTEAKGGSEDHVCVVAGYFPNTRIEGNASCVVGDGVYPTQYGSECLTTLRCLGKAIGRGEPCPVTAPGAGVPKYAWCLESRLSDAAKAKVLASEFSKAVEEDLNLRFAALRSQLVSSLGAQVGLIEQGLIALATAPDHEAENSAALKSMHAQLAVVKKQLCEMEPASNEDCGSSNPSPDK